MAHPQQQGNAGPQQQAGAAPEDIWTPFIQEQYPDLLSQTYCLPPIFFYNIRQVVETVAGQTVLVNENPRSSGTGQQQPAPPPAQVAGRVFVENPPNSEDVRTQDSKWQGDTGEDRCLQALSKIQSEVMFIISNLRFQNYLHNSANPLHAAVPSICSFVRMNPSIHRKITKGECDLIIIHRTYGLLIGEIKSVGDSDYFRTQTPDEQTQTIIKQIRKAVKQLDNQRTVLQHLVGDLPPIRITMTLLLPNISSSQLQSALSASPLLLQALCGTLSLPTDVSRAVRHCLCQEDLGQPLTWWNNLHTAGRDQSMDDDLYQRLVARFCGPAMTLDIPTAGRPRKVLRSFGEAVAETGLRFSSLTLTRDQVDLLNPLHEPRFMHLQGPPGTGKTVVLLLKALQWVNQGRQVLLVSGVDRSRAVTRLMEAQLHRSMGQAAFDSANIQRLSHDFTGDDFDAGSAVAWLQRHIRPGPVLVIFDEVDDISYQYVNCLDIICANLTAVSVWGAGMMSLEQFLPDPLPPWLEVRTLQKPLRCPPSVTTRLRQLIDSMGILIPQYSACDDISAPHHPAATSVQTLQHYDQPGHSDDRPSRCDTCSDAVVDIITRDLRVGQPGQPLQYRDILILCGDDDPRADDVMPQRLHHHGVPVRVVTSRRPGEDDVEELALATTDQVMIASYVHATGLERRVVIVLVPRVPRERRNRLLIALSRCSGSLYIIE